MLRDSFLDLIPALCFHIHGWEDGSLCQSIQFVQVATLPWRGIASNGMYVVFRFRIIANCCLHFGQNTMKSIEICAGTSFSGTSFARFLASALAAKTRFFAWQLRFGQSKEGSRRRSSAMAFFNFVLCPPQSVLMIRAFHYALDLKFIHDNIGICFRIGVAGMKNKLFVLLIECIPRSHYM